MVKSRDSLALHRCRRRKHRPSICNRDSMLSRVQHPQPEPVEGVNDWNPRRVFRYPLVSSLLLVFGKNGIRAQWVESIGTLPNHKCSRYFPCASLFGLCLSKRKSPSVSGVSSIVGGRFSVIGVQPNKSSLTTEPSPTFSLLSWFFIDSDFVGIGCRLRAMLQCSGESWSLDSAASRSLSDFAVATVRGRG